MGRGASKAGKGGASASNSLSKLTAEEVFTTGGRVGESDVEQNIYHRANSSYAMTPSQVKRNATLRNLSENLDNAPVGTVLNYDTSRLGTHQAMVFEKIEEYGEPRWHLSTLRSDGKGISAVSETQTYKSTDPSFVSRINRLNFENGERRVTKNVMDKYDQLYSKGFGLPAEDYNKVKRRKRP